MGILDSEADRLQKALSSDGSICSNCAKKYGAIWPKCHCATFWSGQCYICRKETSCCAVSDYDWPDKTVNLDREL